MSKPIHPHPLRHADRLLARAVFLVLLAVYGLTTVGLPDNPDAEVEFQTTRSLARFEGLAIPDTTPEGRAIRAARFDVREGSDGELYSWFGIGQALVAVPFYWTGTGLSRLVPHIERVHELTGEHMGSPRSEYLEHLAVGLRNPLLGALTGFFLALAMLRLGASRRAALFAALGYGTATFAWPLARASLSDVQATCALFAAFALVLRVRDAFLRFEGPRPVDLAGIGFALGLAAATRIVLAPAVLVVLVAAVVVVYRGRRRLWSSPLLEGPAGMRAVALDLLWIGAPAAVWLAVFVGVNVVRFGDPLETGYSAAVFSGTFFSYPPLLGLAGVTIAPGKGILWLAPLVLLAPLGFWRNRHDRLVWIGVSAVTVCVFAPVVHTQTFHGAWTFGPRYVLPAMPFLWLGVGLALTRMGRAKGLGLRAVQALFGLGLVANLGGVLVGQSTYHDLALQAARIEWPDTQLDGATELERDEQRFVAIQWDPWFAAPWAHWRIFRHRVALDDARSEVFPSDEIFGTAERVPLEPTWGRDTGFRHLAWVDLEQRIGGPAWPALSILLIALGFGVLLSSLALDPTRP